MEMKRVEQVSAEVFRERSRKGGSKGKWGSIRRCTWKAIVVVTMGREQSQNRVDSQPGYQILVQTEPLCVNVTLCEVLDHTHSYSSAR